MRRANVNINHKEVRLMLIDAHELSTIMHFPT